MTIWTPPGYVSSGTADSGKQNVEVVDNLKNLHERLTEVESIQAAAPLTGSFSTSATVDGGILFTHSVGVPFGGRAYRMKISAYIVAGITSGAGWDVWLESPTSGPVFLKSRGNLSAGVATEIVHRFYKTIDVPSGAATTVRCKAFRHTGSGNWTGANDTNYNGYVIEFEAL